MNHPVCIIEPDAVLGKIRKLNVFGVNLAPIAVAACECGYLVDVDLQIPDLKVFPLDRLELTVKLNLGTQSMGARR
jgi:hypothetical protein